MNKSGQLWRYLLVLHFTHVLNVIDSWQFGVVRPSSVTFSNGSTFNVTACGSGNQQNDSLILTFPRVDSKRDIRRVTLVIPKLKDYKLQRNEEFIVQSLDFCEIEHGSCSSDLKDVNISLPHHWIGNWSENTLPFKIWINNSFDTEGYPPTSTDPVIILEFADIVCHNDEYIKAVRVCDFHQDCTYGEDEQGCGETCLFEGDCPWTRSSSVENEEGFVITNKPVNGNGQYALMRNEDHSEGYRAYLTSPWYGSSGPQCQLYFTVYMSGHDVGVLDVQIITENTHRYHSIWTQRDDHGQVWRPSVASIGRVQEPFRIQITVIRGGDEGFIGVDNITFPVCDPDLPGNETCTLNEFMCSTGLCISRDSICDFKNDCTYGEDEGEHCDNLPSETYCDFENENLCGWYNIGNDAFDWTRHKGATPSDHTGPMNDHTFGELQIAHYIYIEASAKNNGDNAILESPTFPATPPQNNNKSSPFFNTCKLRFFRHMYGENIGLLQVFLVESGKERKLYHEFGTNENVWEKVVLPINTTSSYKLRLVGTTTGMRFRGDIAVDDITLSAECFGAGILTNMTYGVEDKRSCPAEEQPSKIADYPYGVSRFTTCDSKGPLGPTQHQCLAAYQGRYNITVVDGVQQWAVNKSAIYRVTAVGARGGIGVLDTCPGRGTVVSAFFRLTRGEVIFMLIGQEGTCACCRNNSFCRRDSHERLWNKTIGSGGGGATYVYKRSVDGREELLLVAGGGGGTGYGQALESVRVGLQMTETPTMWPGQGGSWNSSDGSNVSGHALYMDGKGGTCPYDKGVSGGFGGGGAACPGAGGGGGFQGGNAGHGFWEKGVAGSSYISEHGLKTDCEPDMNDGPGYVEVDYPVCSCDDDCDVGGNGDKCVDLCPSGLVLSYENFSCIESSPISVPLKPWDAISREHHMGNGYLFILILGGIVFVTFLIIIGVWLVKYYRKKKPHPRRLDLLVEDDQLSRLRQGENPIVTEYNPNYDFNGRTNSVQDLREITRDDLQLDRTLGQGAFGEVYRGLLSGVSREGGKIQVAVKTLPALCTDQAEMDFLMEAIIISKFKHPNIVRFIGVCFERHPRFIILELLEGGDLKTFLRECRIKENSAVTVTTKELLSLATDIAKGCHHLEDNHFIHRDIAARNCLLTTKGPNRIAKIADFGMARDIYRADYYRKGGKAMLPVKWMPPEAFLDGIFTSMTDVWSYGILLWEIFSMGYMPYPGKGNQEVMEYVTAGGRMDPPKECPLSINLLMTLCWSGRPEHRPNFANILYLLNGIKNDRSFIYGKLTNLTQNLLPEVFATNTMHLQPSDRSVLTVQPTIKEVDETVSPANSPFSKYPPLNENNNLNMHRSLDKFLLENDNNSVLESTIKRSLSLSRLQDVSAQDPAHNRLRDETRDPSALSRQPLQLEVRGDMTERDLSPGNEFSDLSEDEATNSSSSLLIKRKDSCGSSTWL